MENQENQSQTNKEHQTANHETKQAQSNAQAPKLDSANDLGYTPEESQFADGKGTQLNETIAPQRGEIANELSKHEEEEQLDDKALNNDLDDVEMGHS